VLLEYTFDKLFVSFQVWSLVAAYIIAVIFYYSPQRHVVFKLTSVFVWLALLLHVATIVGPLRVPLALVIVTLLIVSVGSGLRELFQSSKSSSKTGMLCCSCS
jgi:hypothetical protein